MRDLRATLARVREETAEASTLELRVEAGDFSYRPGQYVLIDPQQFDELRPDLERRAAERGKSEGPGYFSLSSDGLDPTLLEITVKPPRNGLGSPLAGFLIRRLRPGQPVGLKGPGGTYGLPEASPEGIEGFLHICAGSGVAPNRGMIRHAIRRGWTQRHLLVLQDRAPSDILFGPEWPELEGRHGDRFRFRVFFSRTRGEMLRALDLEDAMRGFLGMETSIAYVCGPNLSRGAEPGFVDRVRALLAGSLGFPEERIVMQ